MFGLIIEIVFLLRAFMPAFLLYILGFMIFFLPTTLFSINYFANSMEKRSTSITISVLIIILILLFGIIFAINIGGLEGIAIMTAFIPLVLACLVSLIIGAGLSKDRQGAKPKLLKSIIWIFLSLVSWPVFMIMFMQ